MPYNQTRGQASCASCLTCMLYPLSAEVHSRHRLNHADYWNNWYPAIRDESPGCCDELPGRCGNGVWDDPQIGRAFATAMACIILQISYNFVPVFAPWPNGWLRHRRRHRKRLR